LKTHIQGEKKVLAPLVKSFQKYQKDNANHRTGQCDV